MMSLTLRVLATLDQGGLDHLIRFSYLNFPDKVVMS
jgi:hypothetical protein